MSEMETLDTWDIRYCKILSHSSKEIGTIVRKISNSDLETLMKYTYVWKVYQANQKD